MGPVTAKKLYKILVDSGLIIPGTNYSKEEILTILKKPAVFDTLPSATRADIEFNPDEDIPREVIELLDTELHKFFKARFEIAGSYKRLKPICHDVDIVISRGANKTTGPVWDKMYAALSKSKIANFEKPHAQGEGKIGTFANIWMPNGRKYTAHVDIFITPPEEYVFMLLYAIGSGTFNIRMRYLAKRRGYLLNQKGLFKNGKRILLKTEKQIFKFLGIKYRDPKDRV
jgi:DNA polymerase/3'-5' exonuclease PolX